MPRIPLIGSSDTPYSLAAGAQQSMNCYVETLPAGEKNRAVLRGRPGMHLFTDLSGYGNVRGLFAGGGRMFVAAGANLLEINNAGSVIGGASTIANTTGFPVDIQANGNQLFVVSDGLSYCDNGAGLVLNVSPSLAGVCSTFGAIVIRVPTLIGNTDSFDVGMVGQPITINGVGYTVASVTSPDLLNLTSSAGFQVGQDWSATPVMTAGRGAFLDGFFLVNRPGSRQVNASALLDGSTWPGLSFALKEGYPDNLVGVWSEPPLFYPLGSETLEAWRDTGATPFPLERVDGGFARIGLASPYSPVSIMGKLHMLAGGTYGQVVAVRMEGTTPVRISTPAVEEALAPHFFNNPKQGVSFSYVDRGHWFWVITFPVVGDPGGTNAWVYDATESAQLGSPQWHERAAWNGIGFSPYVPQFHAFIPEWGGGKHIVGGSASGELYEMNSGFGDDDGADIHYIRTLAYVYSENKRIFHHRIEFELETGTAATPPVVKLDWSDDRGETFGTSAGMGTSLTLGPGVTGQFTTRYYAVGLGSSRGRVYRISVHGQGKFALIDANLEATIGTA